MTFHGDKVELKTAPQKEQFSGRKGAPWQRKWQTDFKWHFDILLNFNSLFVLGCNDGVRGMYVKSERGVFRGPENSQVAGHANEMQRDAYFFT